MKLLGLSCGEEMGNSEILLKEALMAAEERGVNVEMIRLLDLDIKTCRHCKTCPRRQTGDPGMCVLKDHTPFMWEKLLDCDGLIISAPVYILTPPGYFKVLCDRVLMDVTHLLERKRLGDGAVIDERAFKPRVGGFLSVGAAPYTNWVSMALPMMHCLTFPRQITVIDQLQVLNAYGPGHVLDDDKAMKRAAKLGLNIAEAMGKHRDSVKWMGDEPGACPVCHSNLMVMKKESLVECAVCGIIGSLKIKGRDMSITFDQEQQNRSRITLEGKKIHFYEIQDVMKAWVGSKEGIAGKLDRYRSYDICSTPDDL